MHKIKISVCIIAKNEEDQIGDALRSVDWVNEKILVDTGSTDKTVNIAKSNNSRVAHFSKGSFDDWRNKGLEESSGDWILYIDADERITPELKKEILEKISSKKITYSAYAIPRRNFIFGKEFNYGSVAPDYQIRLFVRDKLNKWNGRLHERPDFDGELGYLENAMTHHKKESIEDMLNKTNKWSDIEARLMYESDHPRMNVLRFSSAMFREFWFRIVKNKAFLDGGEGVVYAIYQIYSRFISYTKLWEMQLNKGGKR